MQLGIVWKGIDGICCAERLKGIFLFVHKVLFPLTLYCVLVWALFRHKKRYFELSILHGKRYVFDLISI